MRKEADTISKYSEMRRNKTAFIFYVWSAYLVYLAGLFVCFVNIDIHAIVHNEMAMSDISLTEFLEENCNSEKLMTWSEISPLRVGHNVCSTRIFLQEFGCLFTEIIRPCHTNIGTDSPNSAIYLFMFQQAIHKNSNQQMYTRNSFRVLRVC